jgi:hypothetical protein
MSYLLDGGKLRRNKSDVISSCVSMVAGVDMPELSFDEKIEILNEVGIYCELMQECGFK